MSSTPLAKLLGDEMPPLLAGLLYVGIGVGLGIMLLIRRALNAGKAQTPALGIPRVDWPWLLDAAAASTAAACVGCSTRGRLDPIGFQGHRRALAPLRRR